MYVYLRFKGASTSQVNGAYNEWWPNDIRGPWGGGKASRHLSYRWRKAPKKTSPGKILSLPGIEPGPAAWQAPMLPPGPQRWTLGEWVWLTGPTELHRNSPQGLNISSIRVFDQIRSGNPNHPSHPDKNISPCNVRSFTIETVIQYKRRLFRIVIHTWNVRL